MIAISEQYNKYLEQYKKYAPSPWFIVLFYQIPDKFIYMRLDYRRRMTQCRRNKP